MAYGFTAQANNATGASGTTITASFTVGASDTVIAVWIAYTGAVTTLSFSDGTHTYTNTSGGGTLTSTLTHRMAMYYVQAPTPGSYTLTVTLGGARSNRRLMVATYSGLSAFQTAGTLDQVAAATTTDAVTTASLTPTSQPAMLGAVSLTANGTATYSAGTGHTSRGALSNWDALGLGSTLFEDIRVASTTARAATFTIDTSRDTLSSGLIFTEAPGGTIASTLDGATLAASGSVTSAPTGTFASTLAGASMAASGQIVVPGAFASTLDGASMSASGAASPHATGTFASTLSDVSMSASGFLGAALTQPRGGLGLRLFLGL